MPAIEVYSWQRVRIVPSPPKRMGTLVTGRARGGSDTGVMLTVGIGEVGAPPPQLRLDLLLGIRQLPTKLGLGQLRQMRMGHRMRSDQPAAIGMLAELVPGHGRELVRIVAGELRNAERSAPVRIPAADEDLQGHAQPFERRKDGRGAAKGVVESDVNVPDAGESAHLAQDQLRPNGEPVLPDRRDGVVTEDDRPAASPHCDAGDRASGFLSTTQP
jgi:hypothetical protein